MPHPMHFALLLVISLSAQGADSTLDIWRGKGLDEPKIQYLGVGGWLLHWQNEGLLIAPSFSNPALFDHPGLPPLMVEAVPARIDKYMPPANDVTLLLVGHGHYDHLLDVSWVMHKHAPQAKVLGSSTVIHILSGINTSDRGQKPVDPRRLVDVQCGMAPLGKNGDKLERATPGRWFTSESRRIKVMPIESEHAGHILGINFVPGKYVEDLTHTPRTIFGWKPGQSLAWLIDLLDEKKEVVYRIHFQDSAAEPPYGLPPQLPPKDDRPVDVEILSVGSWQQVDDYPDQLLKLTRPRLILLGHWENFFGNDPANPEPMKGQNVAGMVSHVENIVGPGITYLPAPLAEIGLPKALNAPQR